MGGYPSIVMSQNGNSAIININPATAWGAPMNFAPSWSCGIGVTLSSGANLSYTVQVTFDQKPSQNGNWNNHDTLLNLTSSANGSVAFPITGLRLNIASYVSGSASLGVATWP